MKNFPQTKNLKFLGKFFKNTIIIIRYRTDLPVKIQKNFKESSVVIFVSKDNTIDVGSVYVVVFEFFA
jgi:hypothetical protein